jgi:hypothetical protein
MKLHAMQLECHGRAEAGKGAQLVEDTFTGVGRGDERQRVAYQQPGPDRTELFDPCSLRLSVALSNPVPSGLP